MLWLIECLTPTASLIYIWITISRLFVCLPTLELPTFEQQKQVTQMHYHWGQTTAKMKTVVTLNSGH